MTRARGHFLKAVDRRRRAFIFYCCWNKCIHFKQQYEFIKLQFCLSRVLVQHDLLLRVSPGWNQVLARMSFFMEALEIYLFPVSLDERLQFHTVLRLMFLFPHGLLAEVESQLLESMCIPWLPLSSKPAMVGQVHLMLWPPLLSHLCFHWTKFSIFKDLCD